MKSRLKTALTVFRVGLELEVFQKRVMQVPANQCTHEEYSTLLSGEGTCPILKCGIDGECQGKFLAFGIRETEKGCQDFCASFSGCNYYTLHYDTNQCLLFEDCPEVNNCTTCISGQPGCYVDGGTQTTG